MAKHDLDSMLHGTKVNTLYKNVEAPLKSSDIDDFELDAEDTIDVEEGPEVYRTLAVNGEAVLDELETWELDEIDDLIPSQFDY